MSGILHHPALSGTVLRRRVTGELLELLGGIGEVLATRGRSLTWNSSFPSRRAYYSAVYRLRKAGLIAYRRTGGKTPVLLLTDKGRRGLPAPCGRKDPWPRSWNGIWYVLLYDVPEKDRKYRDALRAFLRRMRMGRFQRSAWITPRDIRPEYQDLTEAASVQTFSMLMETRMVLGRDHQEVVAAAWDMNGLRKIQQQYLKTFTPHLQRHRQVPFDGDEVLRLAREELAAYVRAMEGDPLLPRPLWPEQYLGESVVQLHRQLMHGLAGC